MLHRYINQFLEYCQLADFSVRSIQALAIRLNEFEAFLKSLRIQSVKKITYLRLVDFVADYKDPSIHVRKSRVWTLRQFYHFLVLHQYVPQNIALKLPYPKIEKTVPQFLTINEYNRLIRYFSNEAQDLLGLRNFVIILMLGTLGLRTSTLIAINIEDIDLTCGLIWIREKGRRRRNLVLPHSLCKIIHKYLQLRQRKKGPFLISKRKKRISQRTLHMNDELIEILCQYMAVRELFCNSWLTPALFVSKKGNRLAIRTMEDNFKKILLCSSLNVPFNVTCHTLRHSMVYPPQEDFSP